MNSRDPQQTILGLDCHVQENTLLGLKYESECGETIIGDHAVIRWGTIIYADVVIGDYLRTGHTVLIREHTKIGDWVVIGTNAVIDGHTEIGNFVKIESNVYIPTHTKIGNNVFIGPGAVMTNDKYPQRLRDEYVPLGPILEDNVTIGANVTLPPGLTIGEVCMVAAGSVVTKNLPAWSLAMGVPAKVQPLPARLHEGNRSKVN